MSKYFCGIDLGTRSSAVCIVDKNRVVKHRWKGANSALGDQLRRYCKSLHCVVEAGPLSESICSVVENLGATIDIVDSRHTKSILSGKKKTDKIDAEVLAHLAVMRWYKSVYRKGGLAREQRSVVCGRAALVKASTSLKNTIRGLLKGYGIVLPLGKTGGEFIELVTKTIEPLSSDVQRTITDLLQVWEDAHVRQKRSYRQLLRLARRQDSTRRMMTIPGIGPATALAFAAAIADPTRFPSGQHVASYLGLAPRVHQSGDISYHGRITKQGNKLARWLLLESSTILLTRVKKPMHLKEWGLRLAEKKGGAKARVAVARRMAILMYTIWKSGEEFHALQQAA